jgi:hypothetical protein
MLALEPLTGGAIKTRDARREDWYLLLRTAILSVPVCLVVAGGMYFSSMPFSSRAVVGVALVPLLLVVVFALPVGMLKGVELIETWARKRARAKGQAIT